MNSEITKGMRPSPAKFSNMMLSSMPANVSGEFGGLKSNQHKSQTRDSEVKYELNE